MSSKYKTSSSRLPQFIGQYLILLVGVLVVFGQSAGWAQQSDENSEAGSNPGTNNEQLTDPNAGYNPNGNVSDEDVKKMRQQFESYQQQIMNNDETRIIRTQARLIQKKRELERKEQIFSESDMAIQRYTDILKPIEQQVHSLNDLLGLLDEQLSSTKYKITSVTQQIVEKEEQITALMEEIEKAKVERANQEKVVMEYVKLIYDQEQLYLDPQNDSINELKLLFLDQPISKTLTKTEYLAIIQKTGQSILHELERIYEDLFDKQTSLETKQERLQTLKNELERQKQSLQQEHLAKEHILAVTQGDEQKYRDLIEETERQKEQASLDAVLLEDSIDSIQQQLETLKKNAKTTTSETAIQKKAESAATMLENSQTLSPATIDVGEGCQDDYPLPWPVNPTSGVSAYFDDPNYIKIFGVNHGAIDIPTAQLTEIHAPADAYVYKTVDNGYGYSYVILAHCNILTLYGHVNKILVSEGDLLKKGEVFALSGGAPGTLGAGARTTGSHLHFETWLDGVKQDPLKYLNLCDVPKDKINPNKIPDQNFEYTCPKEGE